jgi:exodeoxyribonuclease V beta subunit
MNHLCNVSLPGRNETITLPQIHGNHQVPELEFNLPIGKFHTQQLADLSSRHSLSFGKRKMAGTHEWQSGDFFIGMLGNQFYIIDWKSNHLGNRLSDYTAAGLQEAMDSNNYHLQYYIYLSALYKFLTMRLPNFDYDIHIGGVYYLFIRGIRSDADTGIFFRKPSKQALLNFMQILDRGKE